MDFQCITLDIALMCECNSFYDYTIQIVHDQFNCVNMLWMYTLHMVLHFLLQFLLLLHQNHDFIQWFFMVDFGTLIPYWYLTLIRQRSIFFDIPKVYWYLSYWLEYSCLFQEIESQRPAHSMKIGALNVLLWLKMISNGVSSSFNPTEDDVIVSLQTCDTLQNVWQMWRESDRYWSM